MNLLDAFKQYIKDAMPGGALNPEVTTQGVLDTAALATTPVPILGDAIGLAADVRRLAKNPQERTATNIGLAALGALPFVPAGMFIGKGAKTWDALSAAKAQELANKGVDQRQIWKETGTFKGPDGHWRQEIDDTRAGMRLLGPKFGDETSMNKLGETLDHRLAYQAYPDAKKINVTYSDAASGGSYTAPRTWAEYIDLPRQAGKNGQRSTALHEMQHAIQQREGWARGGSPGTNGLSWDEINNQARKIYESSRNTYDDPVLAELFAGEKALKPWDQMTKIERIPHIEEAQRGTYRRLAGEAEARAVESRKNLNAAQRREVFPLDSYDVPVDQLIIRGLLD